MSELCSTCTTSNKKYHDVVAGEGVVGEVEGSVGVVGGRASVDLWIGVYGG